MAEGLDPPHLKKVLSRVIKKHTLFDSGADINEQTSDGKTAFVLAMVKAMKYGDEDFHHHFDILSTLINSGADVNIQTSDGESALMILIKGAHHWHWHGPLFKKPCCLSDAELYKFKRYRYPSKEERLKRMLFILVNAGAVINQQDSSGMTALAHAAKRGYHTFVCSLIDYGADVTNINDEGQSVLMFAAMHGNMVDLLPNLIKAGVVVNQQDSSGMTALAYAVKNESCRCAHWLVDSWASVTKINSQGQTVLMFAAMHNSMVDLLPKLVKAGAVIYLQDSSGMTALEHAIITGSHKCARWLVDSGARVFEKIDKEGQSLLMTAAMNNDFADILPGLVKAGAAINEEDSSGMTALAHAIKNECCECAFSLIDSGAVIGINSQGQTELMFAAMHNSMVDLLPSLVFHGLVINRQDSNGMTALEHAISTGSHKCARWLVDSGARVFEKIDKEGQSLLMTAAMNNDFADILPGLVKAGAAINEKDSSGMTALAHAIKNECCECVLSLTDSGADVNMQTSDGETPLIILVKKADKWHDNREKSDSCRLNVPTKVSHLVHLLSVMFKAGAVIDQQDSNGMTALEHAISTGSHKCARWLVDSGANVTKIDKEGQTLLMTAAMNNDFADILPGLVKAGAAINEKDSSGMTALAHAIKNECCECVLSLIDSGADVNMQTSDGETALIILVKEADKLHDKTKKGDICRLNVPKKESRLVDMLSVMFKAGAVIDQQDSSGMTALAHAVKNESCECARWLLDSGADVTKSDNEGQTPLMSAAMNNYFAHILPYLVQAGAVVDQQDSSGMTALAHAVKHGRYKCARWLVDSGADVTKINSQGQTVLMFAAMHNSMVDLLPSLVKDGALVDHQDSSGMTALAHAFKHESCKCADWLLDFGASVNICDHSGKTPLHFCMCHNYWNIKKLLSKQKDVNSTDNQGMTPLMYVVPRGKTAVFSRDVWWRLEYNMAMLLDHGAEVNIVDIRGQTVLNHLLMTKCRADLDPEMTRCSFNRKLNKYREDYTKDVKFLISKGANLSTGRLATGNIAKLADLACDLDLSKLQIGNEVDLHVPWNDFASIIERGHKRILRFLIVNGVMPPRPVPPRKGILFPLISETKMAKAARRRSLTKYLIAVCYLLSNDLTFRPETDRYGTDYNRAVIEVIENMRTQPWPLVKLCFVTVSTAFGASPGRQERVKNSQLPPKLQKMLLFQEPWSRLCVRQWYEIPLTFSWDEYEKLPRPRPLLYHWPVGRALVPCDCGKCDGTMYKYELPKKNNNLINDG